MTGWDANGSPVEDEPVKPAPREWARQYLCSDFDPTPYCSAGHPSKATCDCGPIADNE
jgi:hypothetical protein